MGRTARAGAAGSSLLLLLPSEAGFVRKLESESELAMAEMAAETALQKLAAASVVGGRSPPTLEEAATQTQLRMEEAVAGDKELHSRASQAYVSYVR